MNELVDDEDEILNDGRIRRRLEDGKQQLDSSRRLGQHLFPHFVLPDDHVQQLRRSILQLFTDHNHDDDGGNGGEREGIRERREESRGCHRVGWRGVGEEEEREGER